MIFMILPEIPETFRGLVDMTGAIIVLLEVQLKAGEVIQRLSKQQ